MKLISKLTIGITSFLTTGAYWLWNTITESRIVHQWTEIIQHHSSQIISTDSNSQVAQIISADGHLDSQIIGINATWTEEVFNQYTQIITTYPYQALAITMLIVAGTIGAVFVLWKWRSKTHS